MSKGVLKDDIFLLLCSCRGAYLSGEALADRLNVSRAAVWKAVNALRTEGYPIEGATNRGYRLAADHDLLTRAEVEGSLSEDAAAFYDLKLFSVIDSTNTALVAAGRAGAAEGTVYVAEEQTAGRGRVGRSFYSPRGTGVYISILLRPDFSAENALYITTAAAVAGARAAEAVRRHFNMAAEPVRIKWVNDLFLHDKKFSGILTEADFCAETGGLSQAVMGIGFDLCPPREGWPEDVASVAGSLFEKEQPAGARALLTALFLNEFFVLYKALPDHGFVEDYRCRQLVLGRQVEVLRDTEALYAARALDVDDSCRLVVLPEGAAESVTLHSGEVRIKLT